MVKKAGTPKPPVLVRDFIGSQIANCGLSQREIAQNLGYDNHNIISIFKSGTSKVPLNKVKKLAELLKADPKFFLDLVMNEYMGEAWGHIKEILGEETIFTDYDKALLEFIHSRTAGAELDLDNAENRATLSDALDKVCEKTKARNKASFDKFQLIPSRSRAGVMNSTK